MRIIIALIMLALAPLIAVGVGISTLLGVVWHAVAFAFGETK